MVQLQGRSLVLAVSALTSLGFMLIGFDNGLMGGLGKKSISHIFKFGLQQLDKLTMAQWEALLSMRLLTVPMLRSPG